MRKVVVFWVEATHLGGQLFREHHDGTVNEIDTVSSAEGLFVD